jgi:predicted RNA binding protein YcfA (HicA-like mRNA interferase family)
MNKFPVDAPVEHVIKAFTLLGFRVIRKGSHIALSRQNPDGTCTPMTIPNHPKMKSSTLRSILTQADIERNAFLEAYYKKS